MKEFEKYEIERDRVIEQNLDRVTRDRWIDGIVEFQFENDDGTVLVRRTIQGCKLDGTSIVFQIVTTDDKEGG